jgi:hypothetical protein
MDLSRTLAAADLDTFRYEAVGTSVTFPVVTLDAFKSLRINGRRG